MGIFLQYVLKLNVMKTTFSLADSTLVCSPVLGEAIGNTVVLGRKDRLGALVDLKFSRSFFGPKPEGFFSVSYLGSSIKASSENFGRLKLKGKAGLSPG